MLSVAAKYFLLPLAGVQILPIINIVAFGILLFVNYVLVCRYGCRKYVSFKGILAVIGIVCLVMVGSFFLYQNTILRYSVIAVIAIAAIAVLYKYRRLVMKLVKSKLGKKKKKPIENTEE